MRTRERGMVFFAAAILGAAFLPGCGEQDLYKPPKAPYQVVSRVALPAAAEDVSVLGDHAYVAGGQAGLIVVDLSTPSAPRMVGSLNTTKYAEAVKTAATPLGGQVVDIAFVVEGTEGITTYNCDAPDSTWSYNQGTTAVDGNGLYVEIPADPSGSYSVFLAESWKGIRIFDSDPAYPGVLRYNGVFAGTNGYARGITVKDGFAYVADDEMGLTVLDVRVRVLGAVRVVSSCDTPGNARAIDISGDYAFIADGKKGLAILRISGGDTPVLTSRMELSGDCRAIVVRDDIAFIAAQDGGIHMVDVRDPSNPQLAGTVVTSYATGVACSNSGVVVVSDRDDGLYVLAGPGAFYDVSAPSAVSDLRVLAPVGQDLARLRWHATGDDFLYGTAASYDIRYSTGPITEANWDSCSVCTGAGLPGGSGEAERFSVRGLDPGMHYYFGLRVTDDAGNVSRISNVADALTSTENLAPTLASPAVTPEGGSPGTDFGFAVLYTDPEGDAPDRAEVVLYGPDLPEEGEAHALTAEESNYEDGVILRYTGRLATLGTYRHRFIVSDGIHPEITTAESSTPLVGAVIFTMGSPLSETGRDTDEPEHVMILPWNIEVSDHEVTQAEYEALMGTNPSHFSGADLPVENVAWYDALAYCNALSAQDGLTPVYTIDGDSVAWSTEADGWRLPTDAEWEWACRGGTSTAFCDGSLTLETCTDLAGSPDPALDEVGWYCGNAGATTHPVKQLAPNPEGYYDMHGNVWEWCWDRYSQSGPSPAQPMGPSSGEQRVIRGGSWYYYARDCRSAARAPYWPNSKDDVVGFRVVRTIPE